MKNILNHIFLFFLILSIISAFCLVALQLFSIVTVNGALSIWAKGTLQTPICILCSASALVSFILSYLSKPAKDEEKEIETK